MVEVDQDRLGEAMFPGWSSLEWILRRERGSRKGDSDHSIEDELEIPTLRPVGILISREHFFKFN